MADKTYGFIIPVYNEAEILETELRSLEDFLQSLELSYEILVVENGSRDETPSILKRLSAEYETITPFFVDNANVGQAKRYGLEQTTHNRNFIVHIDFWDKDFIRKSLSLLDKYPLIQSSKTLPESQDKRRFYRQLLTVGYNALLNVVTGYNGTDTRGLKALRLNDLEGVIQDCKTDRGMFESELVIRTYKNGFKIKELPVSLQDKRSPRNFMIQKIFQNVIDLVKIAWIINRED